MYIYPWWSHGKDMDAGRGDELEPMTQPTTRGQLPTSGHISPTISVINPRRVHVSWNLSFISFVQSVNRRLLLSPSSSYSSTPLFQILSREKKSLLLFLHSISELKSHVMAKFCNRHNQMEEKKGYSFWSEIRQNKQSMSSISTNLWHFWKCHASSLMSPWASSDPANSSLFGFKPQHWARRNFLRFKLLMVLFVFSD